MNNAIRCITIAALILGTVVTNGCVGRRSSRGGTSPESHPDGFRKSTDYEKLIRAGELLLTPTQFPLAYTVFQKASAEIKTDETDFYLKLLAPAMRMRGIFIRMRPLVRRDGNISQFDSQIARMPSSPAKDFFLDARGLGSIISLDELQTLIEQMRDDYLELYKFLRVDRGDSFAVDFGNWLGVGPRVRTANGADQIAMRQIVAGIVVNMTVATMYDLEGAQELFKKRPVGVTDREVFARVEANRFKGSARAARKNNWIQFLAADISAAWKYAMNERLSLCRAKEPRTGQRADRLFEDGICLPADAKALHMQNLLEQALMGTVQIEFNNWRGGKELANVDPFHFFEMKSRESLYLSSYFPNRYNTCGSAIGFADDTLNEVFPRGEANILLDPNRCSN